jgi:hypothetical protein
MPFISTNNLTVNPQNIVQQFRDEFVTFDTTNTWSLGTGTNDIVLFDGNSAAISYVVISKDPFTIGSESNLTSNFAFSCPAEVTVGLSMSQRIWGQECSIEFISASDAPYPPIQDNAITSISQSTTTLSVTTANNHGLSAGSRIAINGVTSDSRLNYPSLVVASVPSSNTFTCTAGPLGTITSVTSGPFTNQGNVSYRPALGYTPEGFGQVFENTTATNASYYVNSMSFEPYNSGTFNGNQNVTTGSSVPVQSINAAYAYAFSPTTEYRYVLTSDKIQFYDLSIDTTTQPSGRINRTAIIPSINKNYKVRIRANNTKGLQVPVAKIVSSAKTGTTTATITTDINHGLTTGDYVFVYGNRDQTNFANLSTAAVVASAPTGNTFTVVHGTAVTATTYGGLVMRQHGSSGAPACLAALAVQSASSTTTELTLIGSGNWAWVVGDYVNVYGVRVDTTGADLGVDGTYKVVNVSTTTLVLRPIGSTVLVQNIASTNCGGTVIKRTDIRLNFVRGMQFQRERVEILNKTDAVSSIPVLVNTNSSLGTVSTVTTVATVSTASLSINTIVTDIASAALTTSATATAITPAAGSLSHEFNVIVTAVSGTTPTLDVVVQESDDSGTSWYDVYHFPRITASGQYRSPLIPLTGNRIRYVRTVAGSTPSFTMSLNRLQSHITSPVQRQFFDRTVNINTLNATTPSFFTEGCSDVNAIISIGSVTTTAPNVAIDISSDNVTWVQMANNTTLTANSNNIIQLSNSLGRYTRARISSAGSGATLNHIMVKGIGR